MKLIPVSAQLRHETGKGPNRRLRAQGLIPAVLYGFQTEPVMLGFSEHEFLKATSKIGDEVVLFSVSIDGADVKDCRVMIKALQRDPVTNRFVHIDFMKIIDDRPIDVRVSIHPEGVAPGVKAGGHLEQVHRKIMIRCLADAIPAAIHVDVTGLTMNTSLLVRDLKLDDGIVPLLPESETLFHCAMPRTLKSAGAADTGLVLADDEDAEEAAAE